jgi:type IV pilus assembly protein PilM
MALASFSKIFYKSEAAHIHINIGDQETACVLVNNGKLLASQSLRNGMANLADCLIEEHGLQRSDALDLLNSPRFTEETMSSYPALSKYLAQFRLELTRVIFSLKRQSQTDLASKILVTGEGSVFKGILSPLFGGMEDGLAELEKIKEFSQPEEQLKKYAIPIGMALTALTKAEDQINFRQREFSYPNPWKRTKKPLATYLAACFLLAFALYFFGNAYISLQEDRLRKDYVDLLALSKKPYDEFEIEIRSKDPFAERPLPGVEIPVTSLSREDLQKRLNILEKEIRATPDMFPLYPNTPSVTDVLAWLSSHPHVVGDDKAAAASKPRLQLESFSYKMVKRPEQNKAREKYQVKVEIEFSTPTPRFAREFHDILLAPNEMVDPKGELKWSAERGKYRASFFLKDKTIYPSSR